MKKEITSYRKKGYFISLYLLISVFLLVEGALFSLYAANNRETDNEQSVKTAQTVKEVFNFIEKNTNFVICTQKASCPNWRRKYPST
ncbi:MAG: hypothetical protein LUE99_11000 [Bacteroides sp.]|nr:hypothetical protein [Bacteroides sp.]